MKTCLQGWLKNSPLCVFCFFSPLSLSKSENARLALCEHPQWTPVVVMLGLLQCSVPPVLKAEILHCLAAFGKSPEIAASLWQSLEYTQVILYLWLQTSHHHI